MSCRVDPALAKGEFCLRELAKRNLCAVELSQIARSQGLNLRKTSIDEWAGVGIRYLKAHQLVTKSGKVRSYFGHRVYQLTPKGRAWAKALGVTLAFTQYEARPQPGFGCFAFRINNYQGVRARREQSWSVFKNGTCIKSCLSDETAARTFITSQLKLN